MPAKKHKSDPKPVLSPDQEKAHAVLSFWGSSADLIYSLGPNQMCKPINSMKRLFDSC